MISAAENKLSEKQANIHAITWEVIRILLIFCVLQINEFSGDLKAQYPDNHADLFSYREKVFIHTDRVLYLAGEPVRFSAWCVEWSTSIPADASKVLYVELLNNQSNSIIREKIRLEDGAARGQLDIPRSIRTGVYYISACTRWMTNFDPSCYFMAKLYIVNPFLPIETSRTDTLGYHSDTISEREKIVNSNLAGPSQVRDRELRVRLEKEKEQYGTREMVTLKMHVTGPDGNPSTGRFSVSVYNACFNPDLETVNICGYLNDSKWTVRDAYPPAQQAVLPETRGATLTGRVYDNNKQEPAANVRLLAAVPGKVAKLYTGLTDTDGQFNIQLSDQYGNADIVIMAADNPEKYSISLDNPFPDRYAEVKNEVFFPGEDLLKYISRLMINLQIEDAYGKLEAGRDIKPWKDLPDFYGVPEETVIMDDYIKLPALEEVFFEIVKSVRITRRRDQFELTVIDPRTLQPVPGKPLLLLDGVPVPDINPVITLLDPDEIERIDIVSSRYILGDASFSGIINMVTHDAGYHHFELPAYVLRQSFQFLLFPAPFYSPDYSANTDSLKTIPDYRNTLYWNPDIYTDSSGDAEIRFFTSDDISGYRIVIQGISDDGLPGYCESSISTK